MPRSSIVSTSRSAAERLLLALAFCAGCGLPEPSESPLASDPAVPVAALGADSTACAAPLESIPLPDIAAVYPNFYDTLTAALPFDIDPAFRASLLTDTLDAYDDPNQRAEVQRLFDILSWQTFIALQWPVDEGRCPSASITGPGDPQWVYWKAPYEVFLPDGSEPAPWGSPRVVPAASDSLPPHARVLHGSQKSLADHLLDEEAQVAPRGESGHLWDQNGHLVRYETLMNELTFDTIVRNELYNLEGQAAYADRFGAVQFAWSNPSKYPSPRSAGSMTLKLAWKEMSPDDLTERYFTRDAYVWDDDAERLVQKRFGLVGMHVAHKTNAAKSWAWATFEHVDNVEVDRLPGAGTPLPPRPSFFDPDCDSCAVNLPPPAGDTPHPTQVLRVLEIDDATEALNREVQARLRAAGSVWQHYELIGTQWPIPRPGCVGPCLDPEPAFLANAVLETYFQKGNTTTPGGEQTFRFSSCMRCHGGASLAVGLGEDGTPTWGGERTGDFVWMLRNARPRATDAP